MEEGDYKIFKREVGVKFLEKIQLVLDTIQQAAVANFKPKLRFP
jgi:hypothetical protein